MAHSDRKTREIGRFVILAFLPGLLVGCVEPPPPFIPAYREKPPVAHCFDGIRHLSGSKPWAMGGQCCCTPTDELIEKLHADDFCLDLDTQGLIDLYHSNGIVLAIDPEGKNRYEAGPHVVQGGKSLIPPVPGTRDYEEVVTGVILKPKMEGKDEE